MAKWVYMFTEGNATMRNLLGGKGANLAEMTSLGLPVPQGFTVTTEACTQYYEDGRKINDEIMSQIMDAIVKLEVNVKILTVSNSTTREVHSSIFVMIVTMVNNQKKLRFTCKYVFHRKIRGNYESKQLRKICSG